ncbi:hypothetical protein DBZ36_01190 [Alginatibacterium sediminis]|uniref:GIY-YIG domain-containing protein n=1 Tax=Alginatibacterium sediminis TaxID=2164068 RepID=A0A420ENP7_9ALTE|nr:hypothetical protein [Alginatibacterium sediminis]RKF22291.1 hypothetical protein DBZ36_01190 [Alginatibacterium sediminis]
MGFSKEVQKQLGHYVYALVDPRNDSIFYVGKAGFNARPFHHLKMKDEKGKRGSKNDIIEEIRSSGKEPRVDIIRHGLADEQTAFEVEAAVIDALGQSNLTNLVSGHHKERGYQSGDRLSRVYGAEEISVDDLNTNAIIFFLNQSYHPKIEEAELYDATRQFWGVSWDKVTKQYEDDELVYPLALAVADGVIVAAYDIVNWFEAGETFSTRWRKREEFFELNRKENDDAKLESLSNKKDKFEFIGKPSEQTDLLYKKLIGRNGQLIKANQNGFTYIDIPD